MRRKIIKMFGIFIMLLGIYNVKSFAAISATSKTVNSGSTVSILITSNIPVISYMVEMTDSGGLEFLNSSGGTGAGGTTITDAKANGMTNLATFTFSVPNVTVDTKYRVKFSATVMDDENENL